MTQVGAYEAKTHLPELLDQVAHGEQITITRHGVPVALLVPVRPAARMNAEEAIAALREFRKGHRLGGNVRSMIEEGRR